MTKEVEILRNAVDVFKRAAICGKRYIDRDGHTETTDSEEQQIWKDAHEEIKEALKKGNEALKEADKVREEGQDV